MSNTKQFWQDLKLELLTDNLAVESPTPTLPATDSQLAQAGLGTSELYDQEPNRGLCVTGFVMQCTEDQSGFAGYGWPSCNHRCLYDQQ